MADDFQNDADFIAFSAEDDWEEDDPQIHVPAVLTDGQPSLVTSGRKRKADEMQADTTYANKKQQMAAESRSTPWAVHVNWDQCTNVAQMLNEEVRAFVEYVSPTPEEHEIREMIVQWIRQTIIAEFPDAQVLTFGSFQTKLYLPLGDIDLIVTTKQPLVTQKDKTAMLTRLASVLRRANITNTVDIIAKAKVPIIKFVTSHGRFAIDICVNQTNGLSAGVIVQQFSAEFPALRALVLVVKSFLSQRSMNEVFTGGIGSYSIVCMVVSFLQMHPKIRRANIDPSQNLGVLLVEFFEQYGRHFQFENVGLSLRDGGHYFNKAKRGWRNASQPWLMSIEDPQDPANDVGSGSFGISRVKQTLAGAFEILSATLCLRGVEMLADRSGHARRTSAQMSLLGSIMGITPETIRHRNVVAELYANGALHRILGVSSHAPISATASTSSKPPTRTSSPQPRQRKPKVKAPVWNPSITSDSSGEEEDTLQTTFVSSDDGWAEAGAGAQETLIVHGLGNKGSPTAPVYVLDDDEEEEGKYAIQARKKPKTEAKVTYVSDDNDVLDSSSPARPAALADAKDKQAARRAFWQAKSGTMDAKELDA